MYVINTVMHVCGVCFAVFYVFLLLYFAYFYISGANNLVIFQQTCVGS